MSYLPAEIAKLRNLESLNLFDNQLRSLPIEITELTNLQYLSLSKNPLAIPPEILQVTSREPKKILDFYFTQQNPKET